MAWYFPSAYQIWSFQLEPFQRHRGHKIIKWVSVILFTTPFDLILYFFSLALLVFNLRAKFEVSSFNRSRDRGSQNSNCRWRDPFTTWKQGIASYPIFGLIDPDLPIRCTTFIGLRWRLRYSSLGHRPCEGLLRKFLVQNLAVSPNL